MLIAAALLILLSGLPGDDVPVDLANYRADSGVGVRQEDGRLDFEWPIDASERGRLTIDLRGGRPLIERLAIADGRAILEGVDPVYFVTVGTRQPEASQPPGMSEFNAFFDSPASRPHQTFRAVLERRSVRITSRGRSTTIAVGPIKAGPFAGELQLTLYSGSRLVHIEAVLKTGEPRVAFFYDAGLAGEPLAATPAWLDTGGHWRRGEAGGDAPDRELAVRHRAIVAESPDGHGSVALFPPPHQFFFARDDTDNLRTAWYGRGHRGLDGRPAFGIGQAAAGGGRFSPWYSAPPGTEQRLGVFLLPSRGKAEDAFAEALRYTRNDRYADVPGHVTMASHWHMAIAVAAMKEIAAGQGRTFPEFVNMFKDMNVRIVHLGEFHGDGHPQDPGPLRLPELEAMFAECRRLSDGRLLLLPGEEANVHLGPGRQGVPPGHWIGVFPKPVYWIMRRSADEPFAAEHPKYGTLYRVGNAEEMLKLLERERGLAWTAHPRIKASSWAPDSYRDRDFFRSDRWLGAAWKGMPGDLSRSKLGERALDLLDDMANWGDRKQVLGEVDVFKLDHTHELFAHMNINYLQLDRVPGFDEDWSPVLEALRGGKFFTTTGEILITGFAADGRPSGATLPLPADGLVELTADLSWTFPPRFVEVVSGDGTRVFRERIDLDGEAAFGSKSLRHRLDLKGRRWVRIDAWDVAADGAFTQPIWLEPAGERPGS